MFRLEMIIDNNYLLIKKKECIFFRKLVIRFMLVKLGRIFGCLNVIFEWFGVNLVFLF